MDITLGQIFLLLLGATGFWTFLGKLFDALLDKRKRKREKGDKDETQEKAIAKLDSRVSVIETDLSAVKKGEKLRTFLDFKKLALKAIDDGEITVTDLELITEYYNVYHELGGNGLATGLFERVNELPVK